PRSCLAETPPESPWHIRHRAPCPDADEPPADPPMWQTASAMLCIAHSPRHHHSWRNIVHRSGVRFPHWNEARDRRGDAQLNADGDLDSIRCLPPCLVVSVAFGGSFSLAMSRCSELGKRSGVTQSFVTQDMQDRLLYK